MPENSATAMAMSPEGYLVISTFGGMAEFDGVRFSAFGDSTSPARPDTGVVNFHLDRSDQYWLSTYKGLARVADGQWTWFDESDGWIGNYVRSFAERENGDLLLTTFDDRIFEFAGGPATAVRRFTELPPPAEASAGAYIGGVDEAGRWWVAQPGFIGRWDGSGWTSMVEVSPTMRVGLCHARDGGIWLRVGGELRKYVRGREVERRQLPDRTSGTWSMFEDSDANVWLCGYNGGVWRISSKGDATQWTTDSSEDAGKSGGGLLSDSIRFGLEDHEGNIWIGTSGGGLTRFKKRRFQSVGIEHGLPRVTVTSSCPEPDGSVLIGTYGAGLFRWSPEEAATLEQVELPMLNAPSELYMQSVLQDRSGRIWIGTFAHGLWVLDHDGSGWINPTSTGGDNIIALFEDSYGRMWISGGDSIAVFDGEQFHAFQSDAEVDLANVFHFAERWHGSPSRESRFEESRHTDIWMTNGDAVLRLENGQFVRVCDNANNPLRDINTLAADRNGSMWIAGRRGLMRWRNGEISLLRGPEALQWVTGMIEDDHAHYWIATRQGIVRVERDHLHAVADRSQTLTQYQLLDRSDGLPTLDFARRRQPIVFEDDRGRLWFTTINGVVMTDPAAFRLNDKPPVMHIESLSYVISDSQARRDVDERFVSGKDSMQLKRALNEPIALPVGSRRIEIQYTALSFAASEKVRFQIMLEETDADWHNVGDRRTAYYDNLVPGNYTFRVRAANNDGVWNEDGASVAFTIAPFFWETAWFRTSIALAATALVAGGAWWVTHSRHVRRRRTREQFRLIVEASPNSLILVDPTSRIHIVNDETVRTFGYAREELIGRSIDILVPERFRKGHAHHRSAYMRHPTAQAIGARRELFGRRKDGSEVPVEIGLNPIEGPDGRMILATIVDVSARRAAERETARQRTELAHLSRVTMLGELSASLAHELNQPLTAILTNAQAAQRFLGRERQGGPDVAEVREILGEIVEDDTRASEVIRRMRALFRKSELDLVSLDLYVLVTDVVRLVHADAVLRHVQVTLEGAPDLPAIRGDKVQLQQVLLNLLLNAFDATERIAAADRRVSIHLDVAEQGCVQVTISDNGPGLTSDQLDRIFEPFYTTKREGLGMGLSISKSIVNAHGGELRAEKGVTCGATFTILLPIYNGGD